MLRSFTVLVVMLLLLSIGIGLGSLAPMFNRSAATAEADISTRPAGRTTSVDVRPLLTEVPPVSEPEAHDRYIGVVFSHQSADIVARSEGTVKEVYVGIGDQLSAGDAVARIDSSLIAQQLELANASLRSAQAEERAADVPLKEARARQTRREALWESGVISREDLATAEAQTEKAITDLEVARAHVAEQVLLVKHMKATLENTTITASFEGTVAATYLDAGATVHSGTPIISLMRSTDLWVRFAVPEAKQAAMSMGAAIDFSIEGLNIVVRAVIERFSPGVAGVTHDLVVEARLTMPAALVRRLQPGASGLVSLATRPPTHDLQARPSSQLR